MLRITHSVVPPSFLIGIVLFATAVTAVRIPRFSISELVEMSDVIVVGEVSRPEPIDQVTNIEYEGRLLQARRYLAEVQVVRHLKGVVPARVQVEFRLPEAFVGYRSIGSGLRILFLRCRDNSCEVTNPYYPSVPGLGRGDYQRDPDESAGAVMREMVGVLTSPAASAMDKLEILHLSYALPSDAVITALREAIRQPGSPDLIHKMQAELVMRGDIGELPAIAHVLLSGTASPISRHALLYAISEWVRDARAVPVLQKLIDSTQADVRTAAARALWHIADAASTATLVRALQDAHHEVRYYAMRGLADITGQNLWGPSIPEFENDEGRYLQYWREWAKREGHDVQ